MHVIGSLLIPKPINYQTQSHASGEKWHAQFVDNRRDTYYIIIVTYEATWYMIS